MCEFERGTGAREIYPSLDQINKVKSNKSKGFSGRNRKIKRFFRPKTGDLQKEKTKKGLHPKNVTKSGVSPQKTVIWTSICTPEARSLLISSGHKPRLGGTIFVWGGTSSQLGGHGPGMPPVAPGLHQHWRRFRGGEGRRSLGFNTEGGDICLGLSVFWQVIPIWQQEIQNSGLR